MALLALVVIGGKYGRRQTQLELQYQAREHVADRFVAENKSTSDNRTSNQADRRDFVSPGRNLVPLWPLAVVLVLISVFSAFMLSRGRGRPGSPVNDTAWL